jgi:hypothetical protein
MKREIRTIVRIGSGIRHPSFSIGWACPEHALRTLTAAYYRGITLGRLTSRIHVHLAIATPRDESAPSPGSKGRYCFGEKNLLQLQFNYAAGFCIRSSVAPARRRILCQIYCPHGGSAPARMGSPPRLRARVSSLGLDTFPIFCRMRGVRSGQIPTRATAARSSLQDAGSGDGRSFYNRSHQRAERLSFFASRRPAERRGVAQ